ncbi:cache domain-containing sensor histidine kinase [Candidatus Enterococcus palustris]|uniref:cache domain-containing sensor histidine kinase n=1 Tax=Candidatus Enterococcus palustris TaxID=1834189 RepID=UPI00148218B4|nr:sensor histidine kinase [Enterococcus sp. 7F3_DIV0205]
MSKLKWRSLSVQISHYFFLTTLILLVYYGVSTTYNTSAIMLKKAQEDTINTIERSGDYVNDYIKRLKQVATAIAISSDVKEFMAADNPESRAQALNVLTNMLATDDSLISAILLTKDGRFVSNEGSVEVLKSKKNLEEEWRKQGINIDGMTIVTSARKQTVKGSEEEWIISITKEIVTDEDQKIGVIRLDIDSKGIENYLRQLNIGQKGYVFMINDREELVYHQNDTVFSEQKRQTQVQLDSRRKTGYDEKAQQLVYHQLIVEAGWRLIGVASLEELTMISSNMWWKMTMVGVLMFLVIFIGSVFVIRGLTKPMRTLEHSMKHVVSGLSDAQVVESGPDEIRSLARSFNLMLMQMEQLVLEVKAKEQAIHKYEIQTLASQINPHFLYNTLDTIIWMAEFNDTKKVVETTKSLANFFRLSLNQGNEMILLKNEIEHVRQYLFIQQQRYGEQLTYEIIEDPRLSDYQLPKLVIQPIVENAIYHGIKEINRPGLITIRTRADHASFYIEICDNGKGYRLDQEHEHACTKLGGIGLSNIDERLSLQYGSDYEMKIRTEPNQYTHVLLKLPRY